MEANTDSQAFLAYLKEKYGGKEAEEIFLSSYQNEKRIAEEISFKAKTSTSGKPDH
jgi:hypothetical protein